MIVAVIAFRFFLCLTALPVAGIPAGGGLSSTTSHITPRQFAWPETCEAECHDHNRQKYQEFGQRYALRHWLR
jgi:hypothetical protein